MPKQYDCQCGWKSPECSKDICDDDRCQASKTPQCPITCFITHLNAFSGIFYEGHKIISKGEITWQVQIICPRNGKKRTEKPTATRIEAISSLKPRYTEEDKIAIFPMKEEKMESWQALQPVYIATRHIQLRSFATNAMICCKMNSRTGLGLRLPWAERIRSKPFFLSAFFM